jgi:hypothetical protein
VEARVHKALEELQLQLQQFIHSHYLEKAFSLSTLDLAVRVCSLAYRSHLLFAHLAGSRRTGRGLSDLNQFFFFNVRPAQV